ncbi:AraC family transcriptional regulator [Vibrio sp. SCSIO 43136]|uniref:AraC family transcriptional regulator n=1 Tax=Vibrio sp. SCSIO 43136 TaxID=2819101 RepID=UPI00207657DA|nr:AraC family transcriptional regulator [Vibrio sp. SCSIO 43136]USD67445.1 AraC family transcriptional regulator ligand-binding domain-containing protein [Vibrio sp. SCSIO 43136]
MNKQPVKTASKFVIPPNWKVLFKDLGLELETVLAHAELPIGLFNQPKVQLTPSQYFQLWRGLDLAANGVELPLKFAQVMSLESFDVPIFAAICSPNLNAAVKRLQAYKPLIGPMHLEITIDDKHTSLALSCYGYDQPFPKCLTLSEMVFFTQLARLATRQSISPTQLVVPEMPENLDAYQSYFGCQIQQGEQAQIQFSANDAKAPFLSSNQAMLDIFEVELNKRLGEIDEQSVVSEQVKRILFEALPQGESSIEFVASQLAVSKRTLQRKLSAEQHPYQTLLQAVRQDLANHYLLNTDLPLQEISFLLGFQESNSFIRAYQAWTGQSPSTARAAA